MEVMAEFGGVAQFTYQNLPAAYVDGELLVTETSVAVKVLFGEFPQTNSGEKQAFNSNILQGDRYCIMQPAEKASIPADPKLIFNDSSIIFGGTEWQVANWKQLNPSGIDNVLYELHLRK